MSKVMAIDGLRRLAQEGTARDVVTQLDILQSKIEEGDAVEKIVNLKESISILYTDTSRPLTGVDRENVLRLCKYLVSTVVRETVPIIKGSTFTVKDGVVVGDQINYMPIRVTINGDNLDLTMRNNVVKADSLTDFFKILKEKLKGTKMKEDDNHSTMRIPTSTLSALNLKDFREMLLQKIREVKDLKIEFEANYKARENDKELLEGHLTKINVNSPEFYGIKQQIEAINKFQNKANEADKYIQNLRELNYGITALIEAIELENQNENLYENFGYTLAGVMRLIYDAEELMRVVNE